MEVRTQGGQLWDLAHPCITYWLELHRTARGAAFCISPCRTDTEWMVPPPISSSHALRSPCRSARLTC